MTWLIMIVTAAEAALGTPRLTSTPHETPDSDTIQALGSCIGEDGPVNLRRVMFLENRAIDLESSAGPIRVSFQSQSVRIQLLAEDSDGSVYIRNIGSAIAHGEEDADIYLKLAIFENRPFVYWRETYQHRTYRQGLFSIEGHNLSPFCEGEGGVYLAH